MRYLLLILILFMSISAAPAKKQPSIFNRNAPKVEVGCVVPYQTIIYNVCGNEVWMRRAAQIWAESGFNAGATSPVGAKGLCQFMPATWKQYGEKGKEPTEPEAAVRAQHKYMNYLTRFFTGDYIKAIAGYNAGEGNIRRSVRLANSLGMESREAWISVLPRITGKYAAETVGYIRKNEEYRRRIVDMLLKK